MTRVSASFSRPAPRTARRFAPFRPESSSEPTRCRGRSHSRSRATTSSTIGIGPVPSRFLLRAITGANTANVKPGYIAGALDEGQPPLLAGLQWQVYDDHDALLSSGTLPGQTAVAVDSVERTRARLPRRLLRRRPLQPFRRRHAHRKRLTDPTPPIIGSLRLLDHLGNPVEHVANGETATLRFTVGDLSGVDIMAPNSAATTISYRVHGTAAWVPLQNVVESTDAGPLAYYDHQLPGDVNHADLSSATAHPDSLIDLQITAADKAGNGLTWTQSPAFVVGTVPVPPKHRAVR